MRSRIFTSCSKDSRCTSEAAKDSAQANSREKASLTWVSPALCRRFASWGIFWTDAATSSTRAELICTSPVIFCRASLIGLLV